MNTAEQILVIFLSGALAVLLTLSIVVLVKVVQIVNHLKRLTDKAEEFTNKAEALSVFVSRKTRSVAVGRLVTNIFENVFQKNTKTTRKKKR